MTRPAAFLDRDGTLNVQPPPHDYLTSAAQFRWLPGAIDGAARLADAGYALIVVSNQRGIARGLLDQSVLADIEAEIQAGLAERDCRIALFRYCPHEVDAGCDCRKPAAGMVLSAAEECGLDLERSWMIGDAETDVLAGRAAGCQTALLTSGRATVGADLIAPTLEAASRAIVSRVTRPGSPVR